MNLAAIQLSEFLGEYLRILRREEEALGHLQELRRANREVFETWQRIIFLEVEMQLAFERIAEVLDSIDLNPYIDEKCRQVILSSADEPDEAIEASLELLRRREGLIKELQKYLLDSPKDMIQERSPDYVVEGFVRRWEEGLRRLEHAGK